MEFRAEVDLKARIVSGIRLPLMSSDPPAEATIAPSGNSFATADVIGILRERRWLPVCDAVEDRPDLLAWCARAADLLGPQAGSHAALGELLSLVFAYEASAVLQEAGNQDVLARSGAREVIRELANRILDGGDVDSERFKEIVEGIKASVPYRSREMFHPIRVALTGRAGEGDLDRVILLLDAAMRVEFAVPVKGARQRILEFCAALD